MYTLNHTFWRNISRLFGYTQWDFSTDVIGKSYNYYALNKNGENLMVKDVLNICNSLFISFKHFITTDGVDAFSGDRMDYILPKEQFRNISFRFDNWSKAYGKNSFTGLTREGFAQAIGLSYNAVYLYSKPESFTMKMSALLDVCNKLDLNLSDFIDDPNDALPVIVTEKEEDCIKTLKREVRELKKQNKELASRHKDESNTTGVARMIVSESEGEYRSGANGSSVRPWIFNRQLLETMPSRVGVSPNAFYKNIEIKSSQTKRYVKGFEEGSLLVISLVRLCNYYGVSSRYFFCREGDMDDAMSKVELRTDGTHSTVAFHPDRLREALGVLSISGVGVGEAMSEIGSTPRRIYALCSENSTLTVDELARLCTLMGMSPWAFIEDRNPGPAYHVTFAEALLEENRRLRAEVIGLKRKLAKKKE